MKLIKLKNQNSDLTDSILKQVEIHRTILLIYNIIRINVKVCIFVTPSRCAIFNPGKIYGSFVLCKPAINTSTNIGTIEDKMNKREFQQQTELNLKTFKETELGIRKVFQRFISARLSSVSFNILILCLLNIILIIL